MFLNNSQNSKESACVGVSFQIKFTSSHSQMLFKKIANFTGKHLCCSLLWYDCSSQKCNFIKKRLQRRLFPLKFAKFLRAPCFPEHLQWLPLKVLGFQLAILLKKRIWKRCFSVNFAKFLRTSFDRTPSDDCLLCLYVNFETFFRTLLLWSASEKLLFYVQVAGFQPPDSVKNCFTGAFQAFYTRSRSSHSKVFI